MRLIRGGQGARAVVVGIDRYDLAQIPPLTGAVADALTACKWLLDIGVVPAAIDLHLSPSKPLGKTQLSVNGQNLQSKDATWRSVWASLNRLAGQAGERLFVFLSGHGLVVPPTEPVFLLQDYGIDGDWSCNLGLNSFVDYFLSLDFGEQFLFCDACEEFFGAPSLRSTVSPRRPPNHGSLVPGKGGLLAVHSASPGQRAFEDEGRGLMMKRLLEALDTGRLANLPSTDPAQPAVVYDWDSGEWGLNLTYLIDKVVQPEVSRVALARKGAAQDPRAVPSGGRIGDILRWTRDDLGEVIVEVDPPPDAADVEKVRLVTLEPTWACDVVNPSAELPRTVKLPVGIDLVAMATGRLVDRPVTPPRQDSRVAEQSRVTFRLADPRRGASEPAVIGGFNVRIYESDGAERYDAGEVYAEPPAEDLIRDVHLSGFGFHQGEIGPDIALPPRLARGISWGNTHVQTDLITGPAPVPEVSDRDILTEGARLAHAWAGFLKDRLGAVVVISPPGVSPEAARPNLVLCYPAGSHLTGYLAPVAPLLLRRLGDSEVVKEVPLGSDAQSGEAGFHLISVPPDAYELTLDLPWGRWRETALITAGEQTRIALPASIGRPPLRNDLSGTRVRAAKRSPAIGRLVRFRDLDIAACPLVRFATDAEATRVEPLGAAAHPAWDAVFTAQRLDLAHDAFQRFSLAPMENGEGSAAAMELELLYLVRCYSKVLVGRTAHLGEETQKLALLGRSVDSQLLAYEPGAPDPVLRERIEGLWKRGRRPLLRWGYDLLIAHELANAEQAAAETSRQLVGSAWTALRRP